MNKLRKQSPIIFFLFLTSLLLAGTVYAQAPSAQEVLDNWAAARGGRDYIDQMNSMESNSEMTLFGMKGTINNFVASPDKYLMKFDLGGIFSISQLANGNKTWAKDQDGNVGETAGKDRTDLMSSAYMENLNHLRSGALPSIISKIETEIETGLLVVTITPDEGSTSHYYFDQKTWLPVRSESNETGGGTLVTKYSDWQSSGGILFAREISQKGADPQNDMLLKVTELTVNPTWNIDPFTPLVGKIKTEMVLDQTLASSIPMRLQGVHIYVDVMVNETGPYSFIYDSGAGMTVIDRSLAENLGLSLQGEIAGGGVGENSIEVALANGVTIGMPGIEVQDQTVGVIDIINSLEDRIGCRVDGILGYGFITQFVTEIDYANLRLGLHDPEKFDYQGDGVIVPMGMDGSTPRIKAIVKGYGQEPVTGYFMLDTGSGGCISMARPFAEKNSILDSMPKTVTSRGGFGVGGTTSSLIGRLESVQLGDLVFREPVVSISMDKAGAGADQDNAGLIGGRIMAQCTTFLDYAGKRLILEPNKNYSKPFFWNKSGITLKTLGRKNFHHFIVSDVVENSPGQKAGLKNGDVIMEIDGIPADEWDAHEVSDLFRGSDRKLKVVLNRDGENRSVSIILKDMI
ncbi:MAG: PDZ domain-containing protein [bacterium]|nr:PDZ domain-containing protein [bacterium]